MEIGEAVEKPAKHDKAHDKCPFCPTGTPQKRTTHVEEPEGESLDGEWYTFAGRRNNSKILRAIMADPSRLGTDGYNPDARPKDGKDGNQSKQKPNPRPTSERLRFVFNKFHYSFFYSYQAHHLISGNQALKGSEFERWLCKSRRKIKEDTGYSINNATNGFWVPSAPMKGAKFPEGKPFADQEDDVRYAIAAKIMDAEKIQFHLGPHNISDPDKNIEHERYDEYIKDHLKGMHKRMLDWAGFCPFCPEDVKKNERLQPSVRVNRAMDKLSKHLKKMIKYPVKKWKFFLSTLALQHKKEHTKTSDKQSASASELEKTELKNTHKKKIANPNNQ